METDITELNLQNPTAELLIDLLPHLFFLVRTESMLLPAHMITV